MIERATDSLEQRVLNIETRQTAILTMIERNNEMTARIEEILRLPETFWTWCSKWGRRISIFAKYATPVLALGVVINQFMHIDLVDLFKAWWKH